MAPAKKEIRGTREWAVAEIDCCTGCSHGCRYCYARYAHVDKRGGDPASWTTPVASVDALARKWPRYPGQVMFPAHHDILPEILDDCLTVLDNLLAAGNRVLVVSKPHLQCIERICSLYREQRRRILFRFSITARDDSILGFWEPGAPSFGERLASLRHAAGQGFATSVSIEPMLDRDDVVGLVEELSPHVSHSIWIGRMNRIEQRVSCDSKEMERELQRIRSGQSDESIIELYRQLRSQPLVRWKESIKKVVGIPLTEEPGLDI